MATINKMITLFAKNWESLVVMILIMVSALIVFLGALKPILFDRIKNKNLRGSALFFASIVLSFGATALAFWVKDWNFDYYLYASAGLSVCTIVLYALYEYSRLRAFIDWLGNLTWKRLFSITPKDGKELKKELNIVLNDLSKDTKKKLKEKHDKELDNV